MHGRETRSRRSESERFVQESRAARITFQGAASHRAEYPSVSCTAKAFLGSVTAGNAAMVNPLPRGGNSQSLSYTVAAAPSGWRTPSPRRENPCRRARPPAVRHHPAQQLESTANTEQ